MFESFKIYKDNRINGRVGRLNRQAYCYLLLPADKAIDEKAKKRLNVISKFTNLGSGFKIAMEDLEIRGAGSLLGRQQHGYISLIGFDLYCRLLKDSIKKLTKNENLKNRDKLIRTYVNSPRRGGDH